ncbi:MAG: alkaline phosphatase family protein [Novosphingobium sp.]
MALADIDTFVIAMMENRSFDHMLGYLSLDETPNRLAVEGLRSDPQWRAQHANRCDGVSYEVRRLTPQQQTIADPPHGQKSIGVQISTPPAGPGPTQMGGFVEAYVKLSKKPPPEPHMVMGYYDAAAVPTFDFLARNFCVCDHWFAALPLGTQANRLMAMAGESRLVDNSGLFLPEQPLVYDWLAEHEVPWCAYQSGGFFPFFSLMAKWLPEITTSLTLSELGGRGRFRRYKNFRKEWKSTKKMPNVIFVEPQYGDGPHKDPNDDHPPTGVAPGQALLADLYGVLTSNPARWARTLLIVTYDEHGGFYDHVAPLPLPTTIAGQLIATTGPRVPALLVSPHVAAGQVFDDPLDHTSILQLLDERFAGGRGYSPAVAKRQASLGRIADALAAAPRATTPAIPKKAAQAAAKALVQARALQADAAAEPEAPDTPNAVAFDAAARKFALEHPELAEQPGWEDLRQYLATQPPPDPAATQP